MKIVYLVLISGLFNVLSLMCNASDTGQENSWRDYVSALPALEEKFVPMLRNPEDPQLKQELYKYLYGNLSWGYFLSMYQDTAYPDFWPAYNQVYHLGFPNPDAIYYQAVVDDQGRYRIKGYRGSTYIVDFQVGSGALFAWGYGKMGPSMGNVEIGRDITVNDEGSFEFILSPERPEGYQGNWMKLKPGSTHIWVRLMSYDWENERDAQFAIERLDAPARRPRESATQLAERMNRMAEVVDTWTNQMLQWEEFIKKSTGKPLPTNDIRVIDVTQAGAIGTQRYAQGKFDLAEDEALIIDVEIPEQCRYWMFHLGDEFLSSLDWLHNPVTINGHYARIDSDGRFRAIVSAKDPGVANWLDTSGYQRGVIVGRWKDCSGFPPPNVKKVKLDEVIKHLPEETVILSVEQRDAEIRRKRTAAQLRRRW